MISRMIHRQLLPPQPLFPQHIFVSPHLQRRGLSRAFWYSLWRTPVPRFRLDGKFFSVRSCSHSMAGRNTADLPASRAAGSALSIRPRTPPPGSPVPLRPAAGTAGASFALLYVIFVIGISALLACIGWVAANDVLALNKPEKTATITIREEDSFGDVVTMLKENDLIEYKSLFKLFPPSPAAGTRSWPGPSP